MDSQIFNPPLEIPGLKPGDERGFVQRGREPRPLGRGGSTRIKNGNIIPGVTLLLCIVYILGFKINALSAGTDSKKCAFFIEEKIIFKNLPQDINSLRIWIPYPVNDARQSIADFNLVSQFASRFILDKEYGNAIIYLTPRQKFQDNNAPEIILSFKVKRKEGSVYLDSRPAFRFLKADRLVQIDAEIKALAKNISQGKNNDLDKARAIYDYLIDTVTYYRGDPNICGIGNSLLTLKTKKGICTDYHSLFISLVRSLGIPAKFEIGFLIPENTQEGKLKNYHCWAEFYLKGKGWIPVDVSEADKHPEKREYFFGHIDAQRVHFSTGRDIKLQYAKNTEPLNFFIYPYVELNGRQFDDMDFELLFKELKGGD